MLPPLAERPEETRESCNLRAEIDPMPSLFVIGGGLFGSLAAAYARSKGIETTVFDASRTRAASRAAAGLFKEAWAGKKLREHYHHALPLLERLYGIRHVSLTQENGDKEE